MTAADFAASLRAEMARQGIILEDLWEKTHSLKTHSLVVDGLYRLQWLKKVAKAEVLPSPHQITDLATALGCPVERLTVSREELERRLAAADELANDLVEHLEHERALRRHDREAADALRRSHDEIEVLLEVIEERFPETSAVINAFVAYDRANALRARVAELEAEKAALRCKSCEKPFGERAGSWWRTDEGDLYCPFCEKEEHQ